MGNYALYPFIICKGKLEQRTRTHEIIHLHQQRELLLIGFYLLYVAFWVWGVLKLGHSMPHTGPYRSNKRLTPMTRTQPTPWNAKRILGSNL